MREFFNPKRTESASQFEFNLQISPSSAVRPIRKDYIERGARALFDYDNGQSSWDDITDDDRDWYREAALAVLTEVL